MRIGIDLGGTSVRIGLIEKNEVVAKYAAPCPAEKSEQEVIDFIKELILKYITPEVKGIGIGVPSVVDEEKGIVYNVTNIPSWQEVRLKEILEAEFHVPVFVNNDSNCFALGEKASGKGVPFRNMVGVTLGTGVGAGLIFNGQLYSGSNTGAGEVGCLPYLQHNIEYYCASNFFTEFHGTTGKEAAERARKGDPEALAIWDEFGIHIGTLIQAILFAYDPDAIVLGGSISKAYALFAPKMYEAMTEFPFQESVKKVQILISDNEDISLLGAAALVKS